MYGNFKERAIGTTTLCIQLLLLRPQGCHSLNASAVEYVKEAVAEDKAENYERALELYMHALEYFSTHLKYEKNPRSREAITNKVRLSCMIFKACTVCVSPLS